VIEKPEGKANPPEEWESKSYSDDLLDPGLWIEMAKGLQSAANSLRPTVLIFWRKVELASQNKAMNPFPEPPLHFLATYNLLLGFVIENLLKGLIVKQKYDELASLLKTKPNLPGLLNGHNLPRLAEQAKLVDLTAVEKELLHRLSKTVLWCGRYPVPIKAGERPSGGLAVGPADVENGEKIASRIIAAIRACPRSRSAPIVKRTRTFGWGRL